MAKIKPSIETIETAAKKATLKTEKKKNNNFKVKTLKYPAEWDELIKTVATTVNGYMVEAIREKMKKDGLL